jgi:hypothetical protein
VSRLDTARAALLASGLKASEDVVRDTIRRDLGPEPGDFASGKVRVLCPRGHFVTNVTVLAVDTWPGITILPRIENEHAVDDSAYGFAYEMPQNWLGGIEQLSSRVRVSCKVSMCSYRGSFKEDMLAAELAEAAVARRVEHCLTD